MHRRYNRHWGRFNQPDPFDGSYDLTDPQSLNRYSYVQNDPVNFVDPLGLNMSVTCSYGVVGTRPHPEYSDRDTYIWGWTCVTETWDTGSGDPPVIDDNGGGEPPQKPTPDALTSNQDVLNAFYCLLKASNFGFDSRERAAWVISSNNTHSLERWPWSAEQGRETWKGPRPEGYIAIAHTHPTHVINGSRSSPKPSTSDPDGKGDGDWGAAKQTNAPVYTISRDAIWKINKDPLSSTNPVQVAGKDWWKPSEKAKVKCK